MMKKLLVAISLTCSLPTQAGWLDSEEVTMTKGARLNACPTVTLEQMVDSFLASPSWESFDSDGRTFVNIKGGLEFNNKPVNGLIQFELFEDNSLDINAFELNEIAQNQLMTMGLIGKMCESAQANYPVDESSLESGYIEATVLSLESVGEEALSIRTDKGEFIMNGSVLTVDEHVALELASMNQTTLCFLGTDASYKDGVRKQCTD
ncbi:TPA: hypothetical protein NJ311_003626 [Vibrio parahaemolyticus]|nr:hypothetical protein [Vibrio parahaemolyticus]